VRGLHGHAGTSKNRQTIRRLERMRGRE